MTPEDCLTPSQEATRAQRALLETEQKLRKCEHALNSERWFRKKGKEELVAALERCAELEAKGTIEEPKSEGRFPAKAYGGSN